MSYGRVVVVCWHKQAHSAVFVREENFVRQMKASLEDGLQSVPHRRPSYGATSTDGLVRRATRMSSIELYEGGKTSQINQLIGGVTYGLQGYNSKLNLLLVFVPLGIVGGWLKWPDFVVFLCNFIGIIPLSLVLGKATEDIAEHTNETLGALVNVTFGNAIELILSVSALRAGRFRLIQDTLVGSVLSNLLLVLGSSFAAGGVVYKEQAVLRAVSEANADLLTFAVFGFSIPALFSIASDTKVNAARRVVSEERMSLITAVCLLIIYAFYLYFQLVTHAEFYEEVNNEEGSENENSRDHSNVSSLPVAIGMLILSIGVVAILSEILIDSIDGFSKSAGLSETFIAVILLPVIGNAVEHMSAILVAYHNKIDLAIGIACGSSVQIALFAAPVMVLVSWCTSSDRRLTLNFDVFDTAALAFSVFVVNATLADTRTNWLEGAVLVMCYVIIASAFLLMD